jgi:hypothetical protein
MEKVWHSWLNTVSILRQQWIVDSSTEFAMATIWRSLVPSERTQGSRRNVSKDSSMISSSANPQHNPGRISSGVKSTPVPAKGHAQKELSEACGGRIGILFKIWGSLKNGCPTLLRKPTRGFQDDN